MEKVKVLVISNNALSQERNNGKTLESFFKNKKKYDVAQVYFYNELPNSNVCEKFYRITEKNLILKLLNKKNSVGEFVSNQKQQLNIQNNEKIIETKNLLKKSELCRLLRELLWILFYKKDFKLKEFINEFNPNLIFFCAGDSIFACRIALNIKKYTNSSFVTYITDDYIMPRRSISPFGYFRRKYIFYYVKKCIDNSDGFITISPKMREEYSKIFNKNSFVAFNLSVNNKEMKPQEYKGKRKFSILYAGGMQYGRDKILLKIIKSLKEINKNSDFRFCLDIFSNSELTENQIKKFNIENISRFKGSLCKKDLEKQMENSDFLLFVESFSKSNIEKTKLSLSTKISEYLSFGKCIIAIGPDNIGSMEFLKDYAYCINNEDSITKELNKLFLNIDVVEEYAKKSISFFNRKEIYKIQEELEDYLDEVCRN